MARQVVVASIDLVKAVVPMLVKFARLDFADQKKAWRTFAHNQNGSITIMFAAALMVLLGFVGLAIDFTKAVSARDHLQNSLDASLLAASLYSKDNLTDQVVAQRMLANKKAQNKSEFDFGEITISLTKNGSETMATATAEIPTTFMKLFGFDKVNISAISGVSAEATAADIALVLDTTDSMDGAKLDGVKTAASDLVDTVLGDPRMAGSARISIVPFADYMNVGLEHRNAWWIKDTQDYVNVQHIDGYWTQVGVGCKAGTERTVDQIVGYTDGVPIIQQVTLCDPERYDQIYISGYDVTTNYVWNGCVSSRPYPQELEDGSYELYKVQGMTDPYVKCPSEIKPLSNDAASLKTSISALVARGQTYIPSGLLWGQRVLSEQEPFAVTSTEAAKKRKIMVIMSDGQNTVAQGDYWQHEGYDQSIWLEHRGAADIERANNVTLAVCAKARTSGVEIFVVGFEVATEAARSLLRQCAVQYYEAKDVGELRNL